MAFIRCSNCGSLLERVENRGDRSGKCSKCGAPIVEPDETGTDAVDSLVQNKNKYQSMPCPSCKNTFRIYADKPFCEVRCPFCNKQYSYDDSLKALVEMKAIPGEPYLSQPPECSSVVPQRTGSKVAKFMVAAIIFGIPIFIVAAVIYMMNDKTFVGDRKIELARMNGEIVGSTSPASTHSDVESSSASQPNDNSTNNHNSSGAVPASGPSDADKIAELEKEKAKLQKDKQDMQDEIKKLQNENKSISKDSVDKLNDLQSKLETLNKRINDLEIGGNGKAGGVGGTSLGGNTQSGKMTPVQIYASFAGSVPLVEQIGGGSGSGFVIEADGIYCVVTNRHVIEGSARGMILEFNVPETGKNTSKYLKLSNISVTQVHKTADLAIMDLGAENTKSLKQMGVRPIPVVPKNQIVMAGEHVCTIGNPGTGASMINLTQSFTDGLVSHPQRQDIHVGETLIQISVQVNPGNSGGPLINDEGRVIGIIVGGFRRGSNNTTLEGLNLAVHFSHLYEMMNNISSPVNAKEINDIVNPTVSDKYKDKINQEMERLVGKIKGEGYSLYGGVSDSAIKTFPLNVGKSRSFLLECKKGVEYCIAGSAFNSPKYNIDLMTKAGIGVASTDNGKSEPFIKYTPQIEGKYYVTVSNVSSEGEAAFLLIFAEKK